MTVFYSVSRFVESVLELHPEALQISVVFDSKQSVDKNKYGNYNLKVSGVIVDQKLAYSYKKTVETFGGPVVISVSESKTRKVNPQKSIQVLNITTKMSSFKSKDDEESVQYYPSTITAAVNDCFKKIHATKAEFKEAAKSEPEIELEFL